MIKTSIAKLAEKVDLSEKESEETMLEIMRGAASEAQISAYLMGLRIKGETVDEITGSVQAMRSMAQRVQINDPMVVDTCGTGGDGANTFNISTAAALVVAGTGITVAKHGNRSISSRSGSADVLASLGVEINLSPEHVAECINEVGIGFLFAPSLSWRHETLCEATDRDGYSHVDECDGGLYPIRLVQPFKSLVCMKKP